MNKDATLTYITERMQEAWLIGHFIEARDLERLLSGLESLDPDQFEAAYGGLIQESQ